LDKRGKAVLSIVKKRKRKNCLKMILRSGVLCIYGEALKKFLILPY